MFSPKRFFKNPLFQLFSALFIIGLLLSLFFIINWYRFEVKGDSKVSGKVVELNSQFIIVQDRKRKDRTVMLQPNTQILYGREVVLQVEVGQFIHASGKINENNVIVADVIRIIPPDRPL